MQIFTELQRLVQYLKPWDGSWALCGGVVATVYRDTPRFTGDIDVAVVDTSSSTAEEIATSVLKEMGYTPKFGFVPDPGEGKGQKKALICGRAINSERFVGVDFLLPIFPWVQNSVERARSNLLDYGFAKIPAITVEDLILAKLNAIQSKEHRATDVDDIKSVLNSNLKIDKPYIERQAALMNFAVPDWLKLD